MVTRNPPHLLCAIQNQHHRLPGTSPSTTSTLDMRPNLMRAKKACNVCWRSRILCQGGPPCELCVRRDVVCNLSSAIATILNSTETSTPISHEDKLESSHTSNSRKGVSSGQSKDDPTDMESSLSGRCKLDIFPGSDSRLDFRPGSEIAIFSRWDDDHRQPVPVDIPEHYPTFRGKDMLNFGSCTASSASMMVESTVPGAQIMELNLRCTGSFITSLPWMYEMLLRCPGMLVPSYDDEFNQISEAVWKLHDLEFPLIQTQVVTTHQPMSFQSYHIALYLQCREKYGNPFQMTNGTLERSRIKGALMLVEWLHLAMITHTEADGTEAHSSLVFRSLTDLMQKGWVF
ncbi:uncharacterized protein PV07_12740 [Cladophialophora immunda]|uniref:Zn(2)-C6 fungal-type domain-containing protein n=1 Tax=Cladophialophora immunda TaxID=569365 RepID=A0A0D2BRZ9_9EURO|nr:uncharacterized protein PV07_12740 [Cladophialophora immunda]KIW21838.1 hypothetical protein PV07_12740 [Cladophialophora immunda]